MRRPVRVLVLTSVLALGASCAQRKAGQSETEQLRTSIEALRAQNATYARQVEELENRLFILSDQLESRKVNAEKAELPRLPTVALHPAAPMAASPAPSMATMVPAGTETEVEPEIEYAGEAAKSNVHRPVLRLRGDTAEVSIEREPSVREPAPTLHVAREGSPRPGRDDSAEAVRLYRKAYETLRGGNHTEAEQLFREFLRNFPSSDLADNSQYWLGECFYDRKEFAQAVREFRRVIERYPSGNKVPDALLKVGFSYLALGSADAGTQTLRQLQRSYPRHEAAALAAARLAELDRSFSVGDGSPATAKATRSSEEAP
jgi:tol-pal system protein YbgF